MRCNDVQERLGIWRDGEAGLWIALRAKGHLRRCAACRAELQAVDALTARLRAADPLAGYSLGTPVPAAPRSAFFRPAAVAAVLVLIVCATVSRWQTAAPTSVAAEQPVGRPPAERQVVRTAPAKAAPRRRVAVGPPKPGAAAPRRPEIAPARIASAPRRHPVRSRRFAAVTPPKPIPEPPVLPSRGVPEVIEVSVTVTDPQQVMREAREARAEVARQEADRSFVYVVAVPEPVLPPAPAVSLPDEAGGTVELKKETR